MPTEYDQRLLASLNALMHAYCCHGRRHSKDAIREGARLIIEGYRNDVPGKTIEYDHDNREYRIVDLPDSGVTSDT